MTPNRSDLRALCRVLHDAPPAERDPVQEARALLRAVRRMDRQAMASLRRGYPACARTTALADEITATLSRVDTLLAASRAAAIH